MEGGREEERERGKEGGRREGGRTAQAYLLVASYALLGRVRVLIETVYIGGITQRAEEEERKRKKRRVLPISARMAIRSSSSFRRSCHQ